ncbi:radical SAM protein [bacterium]|nr:radical SAM protein [candidate division CSSED10-310 bacterium]
MAPISFQQIIRHIRRRHVPDFRYFPRGWALPPIDVTLELTYSCNLNCPMCYQKAVQSSPSPSTPPTMPSVDDYHRLILRLKPYQPTFRLTGGEPMLYPAFFDIARFIKKHNLRLIMPTNGTRIASRATELVALPIDLIIVTLNGPESVHDSAVGKPGSFQASIEGIKSILHERHARGSAHPRVFINAVWSPPAPAAMPELVKLATDLGVDAISFTHVWYWNAEAVENQFRQFPQFGRLIPTHPGAVAGMPSDAIIDAINIVRKMPAAIPRHFYPDLTDDQIRTYYRDGSIPVTETVCQIPWLTVYIRPTGDVAPCYLNHSVGSIQNQDFFSIWNGQAYRSFRRELRRSGPFPACLRCTGSFLFKESGDGRTCL